MRFFLRMYQDHGPAFVANVFGRKTIVIVGPEATKTAPTPGPTNRFRFRVVGCR